MLTNIILQFKMHSFFRGAQGHQVLFFILNLALSKKLFSFLYPNVFRTVFCSLKTFEIFLIRQYSGSFYDAFPCRQILLKHIFGKLPLALSTFFWLFGKKRIFLMTNCVPSKKNVLFLSFAVCFPRDAEEHDAVNKKSSQSITQCIVFIIKRTFCLVTGWSTTCSTMTNVFVSQKSAFYLGAKIRTNFLAISFTKFTILKFVGQSISSVHFRCKRGWTRVQTYQVPIIQLRV